MILLLIKKTASSPELSAESFGPGLDLIQQEITRQFRFFLLVNYRFKSAMFSAKRTYVTTLRVVMDCMNTTSPDGDAELACDILEHIDLPRTNESVAAIPAYIQREIVRSAPLSLVTSDKKNLSVNVHYDALESQDLLYDRAGLPVHNAETMQYVRFRVSDASAAQDCMVVVQHTKGITTLLYSDLVCYDDLLNHSASTAMAAYQYTKENYPVLAMIAAVVGALTAMLVLYRHKTRQRSGYSYLHTKHASLPRLATQKSGKSSISDTTTPAIAS